MASAPSRRHGRHCSRIAADGSDDDPSSSAATSEAESTGVAVEPNTEATRGRVWRPAERAQLVGPWGGGAWRWLGWCSGTSADEGEGLAASSSSARGAYLRRGETGKSMASTELVHVVNVGEWRGRIKARAVFGNQEGVVWSGGHLIQAKRF